MARHLKRGMDAGAIKAADAKVRETVEQILAEIDARKDAAVRELSRKFDNWSPPSFKLTPDEIERAIGQMRKRRRCAISKSRRCRASCSATNISRSIRSAVTSPAAVIRWSPPRICRS